jgi:DNA-binding CsgD family transcriptional regulator
LAAGFLMALALTTTEGHLRGAYRKLQVTGRAGLAQALHRD